jgi:hypothetical protein
VYLLTVLMNYGCHGISWVATENFGKNWTEANKHHKRAGQTSG